MKRHDKRTGEPTPRPVCPFCGQKTSRTGSQGGKGYYQCTNFDCPNVFKTRYTRASMKREED
jgi:tRNA(Ile2) C34 agmatinyltransferase TiaS